MNDITLAICSLTALLIRSSLMTREIIRIEMTYYGNAVIAVQAQIVY